MSGYSQLIVYVGNRLAYMCVYVYVCMCLCVCVGGVGGSGGGGGSTLRGWRGSTIFLLFYSYQGLQCIYTIDK